MSDSSNEPDFEAWGIVELMGHQSIAGKLTEEARFGTNMLRVDVPAVDEIPAYTKYFGGGAIYGVTITTETVARATAARARKQPMTEWDIRALTEDASRQLPGPPVCGECGTQLDFSGCPKCDGAPCP